MMVLAALLNWVILRAETEGVELISVGFARLTHHRPIQVGPSHYFTRHTDGHPT